MVACMLKSQDSLFCARVKIKDSTGCSNITIENNTRDWKDAMRHVGEVACESDGTTTNNLKVSCRALHYAICIIYGLQYEDLMSPTVEFLDHPAQPPPNLASDSMTSFAFSFFLFSFPPCFSLVLPPFFKFLMPWSLNKSAVTSPWLDLAAARI